MRWTAGQHERQRGDPGPSKQAKERIANLRGEAHHFGLEFTDLEDSHRRALEEYVRSRMG